jgi:riboflavin transporter FmnP
MPDENTADSSAKTGTAGQIAQAVTDLFKTIVSGLPPGPAGIICRFLIIIEVLLTLMGIAAIFKGMHDIVWGCLLGMIAFGIALMFLYGTPADTALAAGQEARVKQILGGQ